MRSLGATLNAYLQGNTYLCADLFEFDVGGTTYRLTNSSSNLTGVAPASGTYTAANIDRERIRSSDGLQVDDLELSVASSETLGGTTWVRLALDGQLDEAPVRVYRAYLNTTTFAVVGCYLRFAGIATEVTPGSTTTRIVVSVSADEFARQFPAVTYEKDCVWNLGSPGCDFAGTLDYNVTVGADSTATLLQIDALPGGVAGANLFFMGTVTADGVTRTITDVPGDVTYGFTVSPAFPAPLVIGSTVVARLGCMKTAAVCLDWHNNLVHFLGAPVAPAKP